MTRILCYGDSNTYGYMPVVGGRFAEDVRWTGRLAALLGGEYRVIEEGCNGRTTVYPVPGEEWKNGLTYLRPCLNSHKPLDVVIIMLGTNDLEEQFGLTAKEIAEGAGELARISKEFLLSKQEYEPKVVLIAPAPLDEEAMLRDYGDRGGAKAVKISRELAPEYEKVAERLGCLFFDAGEWVRTSSEDAAHLPADQHAVLAEQLYRFLKAQGI